MYEERVKLLREKAGAFDYDGRPDIACDYEQAADAIEILLKDLEESKNYESFWRQEAKKALRRFQVAVASKPEWIPVTERLPKNIDDEVLVCNEDYGESALGFATVAVYDGNGWLECWEKEQYLASITHWMPLPEPPKEET